MLFQARGSRRRAFGGWRKKSFLTSLLQANYSLTLLPPEQYHRISSPTSSSNTASTAVSIGRHVKA